MVPARIDATRAAANQAPRSIGTAMSTVAPMATAAVGLAPRDPATAVVPRCVKLNELRPVQTWRRPVLSVSAP